MNVESDIELYINQFINKLVTPLYEDLRRTLEVTCYKAGKDNHGSNFIGCVSVLIGIETISQFLNPYTNTEIETFKIRSKQIYSSLKGDQKKYLVPKSNPSSGSDLAKEFMRKYFYSYIKEKILNEPAYELIWSFRNPHVHGFYPVLLKPGSKQIIGGVTWLYKDAEKKIGISIEELEKIPGIYQRKSYRFIEKTDYYVFHIVPHILFIHFKKAVENYIHDIRKRRRILVDYFFENYIRLSNTYHFIT